MASPPSAAIVKVGVNVNGISDPEAIVATIKAYADAHPEMEIIKGYGWLPQYFPDKMPTRELLDRAVPDRPAFIVSYDGHDSWFNTACMNYCGITADTPDPHPGKQYYARGPDNVPNGYVVEAEPTLYILACIGAFEDKGIKEAQAITLEKAPSWGVCSYFEAGVLLGPNSEAERVYKDYIDRDNRGEFPLRCVGSVWTREPSDDPAEVVAVLKDWNARLKSEHVKISIQKMWTDGVAFSGGALLLEPFLDSEDGAVGVMTFSPEHIEKQIELTQLAGFDMHLHNDADGSVRVILDCIERVQQRIGTDFPQGGRARHCLCHLGIVHPDDVKRFKKLGLVANCTPIWATNYDGIFVDEYEKKLGKERMEARSYPYGDLVRSGAVVTYGADVPGVQVKEIPPLVQIQAAVTRRRPGYPDDPPLVERQKVTLEEAIKCYTTNGAFQLRMEDIVGSLEVGKRADLVVLGKNLFEVEKEEIYKVPVVLTMMDGRVTFDGR